jgi:ElaB/YqjD/DUF883 family membrane-anchored ribosome-binding protein
MSSAHDTMRGGMTTATRSDDQRDKGRTQDIGAAAGEALSQAGEAIQQTGRQAKDAAMSLATEASEKVKGLMNQQVNAGADLVTEVAKSVHSAADTLDRNAPQLAGLVRGAADRIEGFSDDIRDRSVEELFRSTSDFARRNPAVLFGAAAAFGFLVFRLIKNASSDIARSDISGRSREHWQRFGDERWPAQWQGDEERWRREHTEAGMQRPQTRAGQYHGV